MFHLILTVCCTYFLETDNGDVYLSSDNVFAYLLNIDKAEGLQQQKQLRPPIEKTQLQLTSKNEMLQLCDIKSKSKITPSENIIVPFLSDFIIDKNGFLYIQKQNLLYTLNISIFDVLKKPKIINGIIFCVNKNVKLFYAPGNTILFITKLVLYITNGNHGRKLYYNYIYSPYEGKANIKVDNEILTVDDRHYDITSVLGNIRSVYRVKNVGQSNFLERIHEDSESVVVEKERQRKSPFIIAFILCLMTIIIFYKKERKGELITFTNKVCYKKGYAIYEGFFNKSPATIKIYRKTDERYRNEIKIMSILQRQNIVKYYYMEANEKEVRLVFEPTRELDRKLTKQEMHALVELICEMQKKYIVYNNLSIENIRLNNHNHIVLVNFEDAHVLGDKIATNNTHDLGTEDWRPTEVILHNKKLHYLTNDALLKVDVFSLGVLLYYNEKMKNPFASNSEDTEQNVLTNRYSLEYINDHSLHDLVCHSIKIKYEERISIQEVCVHPYFWTAEKKFNFLANLSDFIECKKDTIKRVFLRLERNKGKLYQNTWSEHLDGIVTRELVNFRLYNEKLVKGLLRAIRNKGRHFKELPNEIKAIYRSFPDGYMQYYTTKFPSLLMVCHYSARCIANDELLSVFYEQ